MFDFGFFEILVIGVVGLLVLGPERLPRAARAVGLWVGKIKRTVSGMQREISAQLEAEDLRQTLNDQQKSSMTACARPSMTWKASPRPTSQRRPAPPQRSRNSAPPVPLRTWMTPWKRSARKRQRRPTLSHLPRTASTHEYVW